MRFSDSDMTSIIKKSLESYIEMGDKDLGTTILLVYLLLQYVYNSEDTTLLFTALVLHVHNSKLIKLNVNGDLLLD